MSSELLDEPTVVTGPDAVADDTEIDAELAEEELLVEEISIDGMCGVY
jgi:mycofactocin precursor